MTQAFLSNFPILEVTSQIIMVSTSIFRKKVLFKIWLCVFSQGVHFKRGKKLQVRRILMRLLPSAYLVTSCSLHISSRWRIASQHATESLDWRIKPFNISCHSNQTQQCRHTTNTLYQLRNWIGAEGSHPRTTNDHCTNCPRSALKMGCRVVDQSHRCGVVVGWETKLKNRSRGNKFSISNVGLPYKGDGVIVVPFRSPPPPF